MEMTDPTPNRAEVDIEDRLRAAYSLVAVFPEKQTDGFMNLLALRNMVPEAADMIQALRERAEAAEKDEEEAYQIGLRDGYEKGVQDADERTGGDGEYVCCVGDDPDDRHCPTPQHMLQRMADRWDAARRAEAAAWNDAIEAAAVKADAETGWSGKPHMSAMQNGPGIGARIARDIRALRRAAPREGEA